MLGVINIFCTKYNYMPISRSRRRALNEITGVTHENAISHKLDKYFAIKYPNSLIDLNKYILVILLVFM